MHGCWYGMHGRERERQRRPSAAPPNQVRSPSSFPRVILLQYWGHRRLRRSLVVVLQAMRRRRGRRGAIFGDGGNDTNTLSATDLAWYGCDVSAEEEKEQLVLDRDINRRGYK